MEQLSKNLKIILASAILLLLGCATGQPKQLLEVDRSNYYPLAVVASDLEPNLSGGVKRSNLDRDNTAECLVKSVFTLGIFAPFCALGLISDAANASEFEKLSKDFAEKIIPLELVISETSKQELIQAQAIKYLKKRGADAQGFPDHTLPSELAEKSVSLLQRGFPMLLQMSILSLDFSDREVFKDRKEESLICLKVEIEGKLVTTKGNQPGSKQKGVSMRCHSIHEWLKSGFLRSEIINSYTRISENIIDKLVFIYDVFPSNGDALKPIAPEVKLMDGRVYFDSTYRIPKTREKATPLKKIYFSDVDLQPSFEWSRLEGPGISDVIYEMRIYKGNLRIGAISRDFGGTYPLNRFVAPGKIVYSKEVVEPRLSEIDGVLEPCNWYFWTVRAKFNLYGYPRQSEWSDSKRFSIKSSGAPIYFPIRTPASTANPLCWQDAIDWGPI